MNNEEKILQMLTEMRSDIADLKATQIKQGEQLAQQGEQLAQQGEQLAQQGEQLAGLKGAVSEMKDTLTRVAVTQEGVVLPRIQLALEGYDELNRKMSTLATKEQVDELAADVAIIKETVSRHSSDISQLKKAQ